MKTRIMEANTRRDENVQSSSAQARYDIGNGTTYYDQTDHMWQIHDENYHQMVSILVNIVRNFSPLRIEAPEWYPYEFRVEEGVESVGCNNMINRNGNKIKSVKQEKWMKPNKVVRVLPMEKQKVECKNKDNILSDEENEEINENDNVTCENSHSKDDDEKFEALCNEFKHVKGALEMKEEVLEMKDEKVISMENEILECRNQIERLSENLDFAINEKREFDKGKNWTPKSDNLRK